MAITPYQHNYEVLRVKKPPVQNKVKCIKCKKDSGWENKHLMQRVSEPKSLCCKQCGHVTIKLLPTGYTI